MNTLNPYRDGEHDTIITVNGTAAPQGSKRAFKHKTTGEVVMVNDNHKSLTAWRKAVADAAKAAKTKQHPYAGPVQVAITFYLPRPKAHFGTGKNAGKLKPSAPTWHTKKPDVDKLERAVYDALTKAGIYKDDAQVVGSYHWKHYADPGREPGATIKIRPMENLL